MTTSLTDDERARIAELHAKGLGRNDIARQIGRSAGAVTHAAQAMGLAFDTSHTEVGVARRAQDLRERRIAMQHRLMTRAEFLMSRLEASEYKVLLRGEGGAEVTEKLAYVPSRDEKDLAWAIGSHLANEERLGKLNGDAGVENAKDVVTTLMAGLRAVYQEAAEQ